MSRCICKAGGQVQITDRSGSHVGYQPFTIYDPACPEHGHLTQLGGISISSSGGCFTRTDLQTTATAAAAGKPVTPSRKRRLRDDPTRPRLRAIDGGAS